MKHGMLKMQTYLLTNSTKMTIEDCQLIFKLRTRMIDVKTNMKGKYYTYECDACKIEEESQAHIFKCQKIKSLSTETEYEIPEYDKIFDGKVMEQLKISKVFKQNILILDKLRKQ